tara:strand:+ start:630 stop:833 length:204 start_codon:yes stop_codon:yes gene_type:complete
MDYRTLVIGALVTASVPLAEAAAKFNPDAISDVRAWAVGIAAASVRQVGVYVMAKMVERGFLPQPRA